MPKKSAARKDGLTWEILRDGAALLCHIAELFSNGSLPKDLWTYLAAALMYPFHKKLLEDRVAINDPTLRPVTVGSVITRVGCRILVKMNMLAVADTLLLSH